MSGMRHAEPQVPSFPVSNRSERPLPELLSIQANTLHPGGQARSQIDCRLIPVSELTVVRQILIAEVRTPLTG